MEGTGLYMVWKGYTVWVCLLSDHKDMKCDATTSGICPSFTRQAEDLLLSFCWP